MPSRRTLLVTSALLLLLLIGGAFWPVPYVLPACLGLALILLSAPAGAWVFQIRTQAKDPYNLNELRRVQEEAEIRDFEVAGVGEVDPDSEILCPHCGFMLRARYRACPNCGGLT